MLSEPQNISQADNDSITALTETYPYFVPARYMDAANKHKQEPFTPPMMAMMQLYMGNWLLYCQFLQAAVGGQEVEPKPQEAAKAQPVAEAQKPGPVAVEPEAVIEPEEATPVEENIVEVPVAEHVTVSEPVAIVVNQGEEENEIQEDIAEEEEIVPDAETEPPYVMRPPVQDDEMPDADETLILPIYTEDYFLHQGMHVSNKIPADVDQINKKTEAPQSLMVVMSFSEWLMHFKTKKENAQEEETGQKALKTMWQKEKLAAALEEENEEIPENVFEMAVNSIAKEEDLVSESLAEIHFKQGKYDKAIEMYRKLSLRNPQKKAYFARKIEAIHKEKQS